MSFKARIYLCEMFLGGIFAQWMAPMTLCTHQHIAYNQRCRRYQLLPRSLTVKPLVPTPQGRRIVQGASYQFLSARYIGQTGRSLKRRLKEHRRALRNGDMAASALAEHAFTAGHGVDLSKAEVLDSNPYTATRCMLESWHIQRNESKLNREWGNLPEVYTALLE